MRYAYAETTPSLNLAASLAAQIRLGFSEVGTTIAEHPAEHTHTLKLKYLKQKFLKLNLSNLLVWVLLG